MRRILVLMALLSFLAAFPAAGREDDATERDLDMILNPAGSHDASAPADTGGLPAVDFSGLSNEQIKRGFYLKDWEQRLVETLREGVAPGLQVNAEATKRARSVTFGRYQSRVRSDQVLVVLMADTTWTCDMLLEHLRREVLPRLPAQVQGFQTLGVAVKRNLAQKKHVVLLLEP